MTGKKGMDPEGRRGEKELGILEGRETIIRIFYFIIYFILFSILLIVWENNPCLIKENLLILFIWNFIGRILLVQVTQVKEIFFSIGLTQIIKKRG